MNAKRNNKLAEDTGGVLGEFARLRTILAETHSAIPNLLRQERTLNQDLGLNETEELRRQLADLVAERESAVRRRAASIAALLTLEPVLRSERMSVEAERQSVAAETAREFSERWGQACHTLETLRAEAAALSAALRTTIPPPPYTTFEHPVTGTTLKPVEASGLVPAVLPRHLTALSAQLDRLDEALALVNAIRDGAELETRHCQLSVNRGTASEHAGVYR